MHDHAPSTVATTLVWPELLTMLWKGALSCSSLIKSIKKKRNTKLIENQRTATVNSGMEPQKVQKWIRIVL